jgi:hypothetical protein
MGSSCHFLFYKLRSSITIMIHKIKIQKYFLFGGLFGLIFVVWNCVCWSNFDLACIWCDHPTISCTTSYGLVEPKWFIRLKYKKFLFGGLFGLIIIGSNCVCWSNYDLTCVWCDHSAISCSTSYDLVELQWFIRLKCKKFLFGLIFVGSNCVYWSNSDLACVWCDHLAISSSTNYDLVELQWFIRLKYKKFLF